MSEEWRRGWHPEDIPQRASDSNVLVVGSGPAGLEAARASAARGYDVTLAEATRELGGHLNQLCTLPGLSEWLRVRDWRIGQIQKMTNIEVYRESLLSPDQVLEFGFEHVIIATGAHWRADGVGASNISAIDGHDQKHVFTPDDILGGQIVQSPVVIFDDDPYVMGGALSEMLADQGHAVTLVTPASRVSQWTQNTFDQVCIHRRLLSKGVTIVLNSNLVSIAENTVGVAGVFEEPSVQHKAASVVLVTMRLPNNALIKDVQSLMKSTNAHSIRSLSAVGDCLTPGLIADAVFSGHKTARELDGPDVTDMPFRVEQISLDSEPPLPWEDN